MLKETYETMNEKITPSSRLMCETLEAMNRQRDKSGKARRAHARPSHPTTPRRAAAIALCCVLAVTLSLTAAAAALPGFSQFFQDLFSKYGSYLHPVSTSSEESEIPAAVSQQGISLQVMAAVSDRDNAEIYFTLTDLEGRLNQNTRIVGELALGGTSSPFTAAPVDYDEETKTAAYRQKITIQDGVQNADASLTVTGILGKKTETPLQLDLGSLTLDTSPSSLTYALSAQEDALAKSYEYRYDTLVENGSMAFLQPREGKPVFSDLPGVQLTGAAYLNGKLHLQFALSEYWNSALVLHGTVCSDPEYQPNESYDSHPFTLPFTLEGGAVSKVYDGETEGRKEDGANRFFRLGNQYLEIVDTIPEEALAYWNWDFSYVTYETAIQGSWSQSFTLGSVSDSVKELFGPYTVQVETKHIPEDSSSKEFDSTYSPAVIEQIRVTPLAVTVSRPGTSEDETPENDGVLKRIAPDLSKLQITAQTTEGEISYELDEEGYTVVPDSLGNMTARYTSELPVDLSKIVSLTVNGTEIPLS